MVYIAKRSPITLIELTNRQSDICIGSPVNPLLPKELSISNELSHDLMKFITQ
ncbi:MAG: hypothetical protein AAFR31_14310 [Cyanobacteria bacterium J06627_8]